MAFVEQSQQAGGLPQRFSLLLLEPGEIYFDDYSVWYFQEPDDTDPKRSQQRVKQKGRLKICSKSLVFDPQDVQFPVVRLPFKNCTDIRPWTPTKNDQIDVQGDVLAVVSTLVIEMKQHNTIAPYIFKKVKQGFRFVLNYVALHAIMPNLMQLYLCASLPASEAKEHIARIVTEHRVAIQFDQNWLEDLYEKIIAEMFVEKVNALTTNPGRLVLTNARLYFQPFNNVYHDPVYKYRLSNISNVVTRRYLLREKGLELYFQQGHSMFVSFESREDRERFVNLLQRQPSVQLASANRENMVQKWRLREISNYEYLVYLNSVADRSFNDLTQYPVFPWVVADYTSDELSVCAPGFLPYIALCIQATPTPPQRADLDDPATFRDLRKPIGALNEDRLRMFRERYKDMPEPKFMYGTHYSTPGYVLYYLVRIAPEYMLCLQNGRFDMADRLFWNIGSTWRNVLTSPTDVKELIPEFYQPGGDFLVNAQHLPLGVRQDRRVINDVILPPWAKSPDDFTMKLREALESEYVSEHLHHWINLIFGYKQRGQEAVKANNVFHHVTYEGSVDLDAIDDPNERTALEMQISEFGQTPKQLFNVPHPRRNGPLSGISSPARPRSPADPSMARIVDSSEGSTLQVPAPGPDPGLAMIDLSEELTELVVVGREAPEDGSGSGTPIEQPQSWDSSLTPLPVKEAQLQTARPYWEALDTLGLILCVPLHRGAVTSIACSGDGEQVYSTAGDGTFRVYSVAQQEQSRSLVVSDMALSSCAVAESKGKVVMGALDNKIYFYSLEYGRIADSWRAHDDAVSAVRIHDDVIVTGSWDASVKVWRLGQRTGCPTDLQLAEFSDQMAEITCLDISRDKARVVAGAKDGVVMVWDVDATFPIATIEAHQGAVHGVGLSTSGEYIVTTGADSRLCMWSVHGEMLCELWRPLVYTCLATDGQTVVLGTDSGHVHVWDIVSREVLTEIHAHAGPVTCIYANESGTVLVTGAQDGSIAVYGRGAG